ncbi:DUF4046 domain-containing protein [Paenibacillus polymyxa]|uniref:DUF4046 domain-containing protein n=1 Tax=Paenibacillus polymyxa (strain SC2) TaxID=886882 RepID=E3EKG3_PAEPS|nr:DUF4046 domain-containing protein [Paenibacillus polymyxa]ADO59795.1 hypothetical protein PPSC2_26185 [Paenibacillus polymyxa SC2]WPQ59970.1 DUF4046 domain-containing protein [Paenibacillus polymyxa]
MEAGTISSFKEDQDIINVHDRLIDGKIARLPRNFWGNNEVAEHRLKLCLRHVVLQKLNMEPEEILSEVTQTFLINYKLFNAVYKCQSKRLQEFLIDTFPEIEYGDKEIINIYDAAIEGKIERFPKSFWGEGKVFQRRLKLCLRYVVLQKLEIAPQEILLKVTTTFLIKYKLFNVIYQRQTKGLTDLLMDMFPEIRYTDEEIINIYDAAIEGKIARLPKGFWGNHEDDIQYRLKLCLRYVVLQKLKMQPQEILIKVQSPFLVKYKLDYVIYQRQSKGLQELLIDIFPEIGYKEKDEEILNVYDATIEGKLAKLPKGFWGSHEEEVQHRLKLCLRYVVLQKLKIAPQEILLEVTSPFLMKYKLFNGVYQHQSKGLRDLLINIFPEIEHGDGHNINNILSEKQSTDEEIINMYDAALAGKLAQMPPGFWGNHEGEVQHRLKLCLRYVVLQKLNMKPHEIHMRVQKKFLIQYKLYYAHQRQPKGIKELLIDVFPEIGYTDKDIINIYDAVIEGNARLPRDFWGDEEVVQHRFKLCFRYLVLQKLKIKPQEILSKVTPSFLMKYKLSYIMYKRQTKGLEELLTDTFPEIDNRKGSLVNDRR